MSKYVFVTFAPIQSFIEKSRKLRDLYGSSLILSHLSSKLIWAALCQGAELISPGLPNFTQGMPNRILVKGDFSEEAARDALLEAWGEVIEQCRTYLEGEVKNFCISYNPNDKNLFYNQSEDEQKYINNFCQMQNKTNQFYTWDREWDKWKIYTWELFWAEGTTPDEARQNIETRKLSRQWTAINWMGESSSISGADAIAYPRLEAKDIDIRQGFSSSETSIIRGFYKILAIMFDGGKNQWKQDTENPEIEGKFIAENERLSIPELVKRLVTHREVGQPIGIEPPEKFKDIVRLARNTGQDIQGHWTGWFIGDGDRIGEHLKTLAQKSDKDIYNFSETMRTWGQEFKKKFRSDIGRIIYAGGDDFFGIIYSGIPETPILGYQAFEELINLHQSWQTMQQQEIQPLLGKEVTVSVGFVWVGAGVPQRDVLQHCREAEQRAKKSGRDRVTIRVVFNNGQYIEWTTPWKYLDILNYYRDLDGQSNWSQVYGDLAQLKARHAFGFDIEDLNNIDENQLYDFCQGALEFLNLYFPNYQRQNTKEIIESHQFDIFNQARMQSECDRETIRWIDGLISVGWHLLGDRDNLNSK